MANSRSCSSSTRKHLMWCVASMLAAAMMIAVCGATRDGLWTSVGDLQVLRDVSSGAVQCAMSAANETMTVRSRIDCMRTCLSYGRLCQAGANYHRHDGRCELYSEQPGSFQQLTDCAYYQINNDRTAAATALQDNCKQLLIFQNVDGSTYFHRGWAAFEAGFGNPQYNYWLGNELLHQLTKDDQYNVRFDLQSLATGLWHWAEYSTFIVDNQTNHYRLTINGYSGDAGNAMKYHNGMNFSTFDDDNDASNDMNCAKARRGGFWYNRCAKAHLTTANGHRGAFGGFGWRDLPGPTEKLKICRAWLLCA